MSIWHLVVKEILHRRMNFALGLLSVIVAVACLVGALTLLRAHDARTEQIVGAKEARVQEEMARMEDDYRIIMKGLGFNLLILPKDQNLGDLYADDYASKYMPEAYVSMLSESGVMSIRHLLPSLQQKLKWPEQERTIILIGVRGEVPLAHKAPKEPILTAVPSGTMVVGYELHRSLNLSEGDSVRLLGRKFAVGKCHPERGNKDDITIWIDLREAQELLNRQGEINGILALKCHCYGARLGQVREEISRLLPDTQVIEFASKVVARAEARDRAADTAREALKAEKVNRARLRSEREAFASVLVPLVLMAGAVWIGSLFLTNVRERRAEIGILRALGLRARAILLMFVTKAMLMGLLGGLLGYAVGWIVGASWGDASLELRGALALFNPELLLLVFFAAPLLSGLASWIPAMVAGQQDPAVVLREE